VRDIVLFGIGSALAVEYEETCKRLPAFVIAAVKNRDGASFAGARTPTLERDGVPDAVRAVPCLCPIFKPANRRTACGEAVADGFRFAPALIDPTAVVASTCAFGDGTYVNAGCTIGAHTTLAEQVVVNRSVSIGHHVAIAEFCSLGPGVVLCGYVTLGPDVMIGAGAIVLPSVRIGAGAVIGAGAIVTRDVAAGTRVFGDPAMPQRTRVPATPAPPEAVEDGAPLVSVAIKSYNHAPYVAQAIRSVLDQTLQDFEIVVTDDGSSDGTADIVESFRDPRIRLERFATNRGISAAMNATVARARGEFVAILNSDDVAMPDRLERQVAYLRSHPGIAAVFDVPRRIGDDGEPAEGRAGGFEPPFEAEPTRAQWLRRLFFHGNSLCAPTATIRRSVYRDLGPDDPRLALLMDLDRWIRLLERHEIHVMTDGLTAFRIRDDGGNASAGSPQNALRDAIESLQVFRRYATFPPSFLAEIFAPEIAAHDIDLSRPTGVWLGEITLLGTAGWQPLFALDLLYASAVEPRDLARLRELSGRVDPFRLNP